MKMKKEYTVEDPLVGKLIDALVKRYAAQETAELFRQIFVTAVKLGEEKANRRDLKLINASLKELRYSFKLFAPYRTIRKVDIFGSARIHPEHPSYKMAEEFCRKIVKQGFMVITGAGSGVMEAANKGAGRNMSFGVNIVLPFEQKANPYIEEDAKLVNFKYFFTRKLIFIKESDATVLFPGGFGTCDEGFETLTLFQTGKCAPRPIILMESPGSSYWASWLKLIKKEFLGNGYISEDDLHLFSYCTTVEAAVKEITGFYRIYHSIRFIQQNTVLRLNRKIPAEYVKKLSKKYKDILKAEIVQTHALAQEVKNAEFVNLPRLVLQFNRHSFGRLAMLIREINQAP
jgi:uncharacterized protein (TIGR00730 family)